MTDEKEIKPGEPSETDDYNIKRDRVKTIRQIANESAERIKKQKEKETEETPTPKVEDAPPAKVEETQKPAEKAPDTDELVKKATEEATKKATEEATKKLEETKQEFQAKIDEILNKDKSLQDKQKEADELVASWTKENRLPKDYEELIAETQRIADARMEQKLKTREAEREQKENERKAAEDRAGKAQKEQEDARYADFQKQITQDLEDIYGAGQLKRPANMEDVNNPETKDEAAKETQKVLKFGVDLNTKRVAEGLPPVTSLNKIFFLHYKPFIEAQGVKAEQPAGADAPVSGAAQQSAASTPQDSPLGMSYQELNRLSFAQIKARAFARIKAAQQALK